ncbi:hypothetical protein F3Y22_tig00112382pilonHSYRG00140 [Hibiscus syriacus]|uniref:Uncharacterized protein n=1 Tax=Hibiscus syriacus TaxID=106335 RepID=A0A6A2XYW2_HIBSY|nr:hypothetical protein F3Y22_tig00112382pilonHSYRG00140 [Hibiscus syriacus]
MKTLCFKLTSIIPRHIFKLSKILGYAAGNRITQDQLDLAAAYINHLRERVETLKKSKEEAMNSVEPSDLNRNFMLYQVISILEQEGLKLLNFLDWCRDCQRLQELIRYHDTKNTLKFIWSVASYILMKVI